MRNPPPSIEIGREEILAWFHAERRNQRDLKSIAGLGADEHGKIVSHFLKLVHPAGFALEMVNDGSEADPALVGHWRFRGNHLIGFKQPPPAKTLEDAGILACAALLRNEWCGARLELGGGFSET